MAVRTLVGFIGLGIFIYWLLLGDPSSDKGLTLGPVKPGLVRVLNPPYDLEEPLHSDAVTAKSETENLEHWLKQESALVGQANSDPSGTLMKLRLRATHLSRKDLYFLKRAALNRTLSGDERFLAVYMLGLAGGAAMEALKELSFSRIPGLPNDRQHSEEVILRTQAIEALVQKLPPSEARVLLRELLSRTSDPIIARHVQYWLNRLS